MIETEVRQPGLMVRQAARRRWVWIVVGVVFASAIGFAFVHIRPPMYTATSEVLVLPTPGSPFSPESLKAGQQVDVGLATEANMINSPQVTSEVAKRITGTISGSGRHASATMISNSQILQIEYASSTRRGAKNGADIYAESYLAARGNIAKTFRQDKVTHINNQIASMESRLKRATNVKKSIQGDSSNLSIQQISNRIVTLEQSLSDAEDLSTHPGTIVAKATLPSNIQRFFAPLIIGGMALAGALLGFLVALWRTYSDGRVDSQTDRSVGGIAVWATLSENNKSHAGLPTDHQARNDDAYRRLRIAVVANVKKPSILAVSSPTETTGIAEVATNLAVALSSAGYDVALVDTDTRAGGVAELLGVSPSPGAAEILAGSSNISAGGTTEYGVYVIPAGDNSATVSDVFSGRELSGMLESLRENVDYVIVAAPSLATSDGLAPTAAADGVVLAVVDGVTTHEEVFNVLERSRVHGVVAMGVVTLSKDLPGRGSKKGHLESKRPISV